MTASRQALVTLAGAARRLKEIEEAKRCEDSLYEFVKSAWPHFDPSDFVGNWHLEEVCNHLEAVARGYISRLLINVPPRPVSENAYVLCRTQGLVRLAQIAVGDEVWTHKGRWRRVLGVHQQGELDVVRLITRSGHSVLAEASHPFLTPDGWVPIGDLVADDVVGLPPCTDECGVSTISEKEARLLGYLVGDGSCRGTPRITAADDGVAADIIDCAESIGYTANEHKYKMTCSGYWLRTIAIRATKIGENWRKKGSMAPVRKWLSGHGIWEGTSYTKMVPEAVMRGTNEVVRAFLGAYWSCDGEISIKGAKRGGVERDDLAVGCCSVNREFLQQIQILLWRLGINSGIFSKVSNRKTKRQGERYVSYHLRLRTQDDVWRFSKLIELTHRRVERMKTARKRRFDFDQPMWGESISEIVPAGKAQCICLTVEEDQSFTANGFAVHNTGKTNIASICFVPWVWAQSEKGPLMGPHASFFYASYAEQLALEHSLKCRRLIESRWYQKLWGSRFKLVSDRNKVSHFENDKGGYRMASSVDARSTGWGASAIFADDPHLVKEAESEVVREGVVRWWMESMPSRLNDRRTGAMVVIMQRVHEGDVAGHVLSSDLGYVHYCVPMCYVPCQHVNAWVDGKIETFIGDDIDDIDEDDIFWRDPRTEEDGLLWPERYPASEVAKLEKELGPFAFASQFQQTPVPRGGGIIRSEWWQTWDKEAAEAHGAEEGKYPGFEYILAALDTAYTEKEENDPSALSVWGIFRDEAGNPKIMLMYCWDERMVIHDLVSRVGKDCKDFKIDRLIIEDKAAGHSVSQELARLFGSFDFGIELVNPRTGFIKSPDKVARLQTVVHLFAEGLIYAPDKEWADRMIKQCATVPRSIHDDLADTASMALIYLRRAGWALKKEERAFELEDETRYKPRATSLYPV